MSLRPFQYTLSRYSFKIKFFSPSLYLMKMALNYSQILMKCFQILHCQILQEDGICVYLQLTQRLFQTSRNSFVFIDFSRKCKEGKGALESGQTDGQSDRNLCNCSVQQKLLLIFHVNTSAPTQIYLSERTQLQKYLIYRYQFFFKSQMKFMSLHVYNFQSLHVLDVFTLKKPAIVLACLS